MLILTPSSFTLTRPAAPGAGLDWARSANGQQVVEHGTCAASLLPADDDVVLVLPPRAVSWHRLTLPKVPAAKLRAVLDGLLEEQVLSDCGELHFALEPGGRAGQSVWVAACEKSWLKAWLQWLEDAGRPVTRIVPAIAPLPEPPAEGAPTHVHWAHQQGGQNWLASASTQGVRCVPLSAGPGVTDANDQWWAEPAAAADAEHLLDRRFALVPPSDGLLRSAQSGWNLAQFDLRLSGAARRGQRLRQTLRHWRSAPAWRPARWGLAALVAVQLVGLNAAAWQEQRSLKDKQQALTQTLQHSFPQVTLVLDAPLQMAREVGRLQQASGVLSHNDLEAMLSALGQADAESGSPLVGIDFKPGEGRFDFGPEAGPGLPERQSALQRKGWQVRIDDTALILQPAAP